MSSEFAFVFPGQGSQAVGMLDAWAGHAAVREAVAEASEALGEDIGALIQHGPKEVLALTTNTQPVMLVAGVAAYRAWLAEGGAIPAVVAGHSLGEYSALVAVSYTHLDVYKRQGIDRPAIASELPNQTGGSTMMLDLGENVDCTPQHLLQFAVMGSALVSALTGRELSLIHI